jgi:hypothetical protein
VSDGDESAALRRALDVLVFAPVGAVLTVVEDLPEFVAKGRQRVETDIRNARFVGEWVVKTGRRELIRRVGSLVSTEPTTAGAGSGTAGPPDRPATPVPPPTPSRPEADPADAALVERTLAGYDTLSAAQVVRRLESLGPGELRAVHRYEASHRHRRTILNRATQLLDGP